MGAPELCYAGIAELGQRFRKRELSPVEYTEDLLQRIGRVDKALHSFVTVTAERALADARAAEDAIRRGGAGPLAGIPIAYKDLYATARNPDHGRLGPARRLGAGRGLHVRAPPPAGGHGDARQADHPRVRVRDPVPGPPLPARAQPVEPGPHPRRLVERIGRRARRRPHRGRARLRHRRLHPRAGGLLRHRRPQADLRPHQPGRRPHAVVDARPHRPDGADGRGLRVHAAGDGGPRSRRPGVEPRAGRRLPGRAPTGNPGASHRGPPHLLHGRRERRGRRRVRRGARHAPDARRRCARGRRSPRCTRRPPSWSSCCPRRSPTTSATCAPGRSCSATWCARS